MNVSSVLEAVTLYRDAAICRRAVTVTPGASPESQVVVGGLPLSLLAGSLRAGVTGTSSLRVLDVRADVDVAFTEAADLSAEQKALEAAQTRVNELQAERERLDAEIAELVSLRPEFIPVKAGQPVREANVTAVLALDAFTHHQLEPRQARRRELVEQERLAHEERTLRQHRIAESSGARRSERARVSRSAVVTLSAPLTGPLTLSLEYQVPGARWVPNYELRLSQGFDAGTLKMRASVAQATGEDWSGVKLSLSTAQLDRRVELPELRALKIGRAQSEPPRSGFREPPPGLEGLFESWDAAFRAAPVAGGLGAMQGQLEADDDDESVKIVAVGSRGAVFDAPPAPPPMPMMAAPAGRPKPQTKSMPIMAASAAAPMRPQKALARRSEAAKKRSRVDDESDGMAFGGGGAPEAEMAEMADLPMESGLDAPSDAPTWGLDVSQFDYARLTLAGPDAGESRGRLQPSLTLVTHTQIRVTTLTHLLATAEARARAPWQLPLPDRCQPVDRVNQFDYRYDCETVADVPSTGTWVTVPVMQCAIGLTPVFICVPSVQPQVFRSLTLNNVSAHALLPGPVDVSVGDAFLVTATLPAMAPGASGQRLGLGVEEAIKVARTTQYRESTGGFLGGSNVLTHEVRVEVNNRLPAAATLEVHERIPSAFENDRDVKIEEGPVSPPWSPLEPPPGEPKVDGARRWVLTVPAGERTTVTAQYVIRIPTDKMLVGGNRRV